MCFTMYLWIIWSPVCCRFDHRKNEEPDPSGAVCFFSVFADSTRVRMLSALAISEMCVTDLSRVLGINQTTVSHQLRLLKNLGIVKCERYGKIIFYSLINDTVNDVMLKGVEFLRH